MPELPEVEIVAMNLRDWLVNRKVVKVEIPDPKLLKNKSSRTWTRSLKGSTCRRVDRRAKYLLLKFKNDLTLVGHLGMTGKIVKLADDEPPSHPRLIFYLSNRTRLCFQDTRRFGKAWLLQDEEVDTLPELASLGPDPLVDGVTSRYLSKAFAKTRRPIKVVLMEQSIIGGIGNILANEILFRARLHPERPANSLVDSEIKTVRRLIPAICRETIRKETADEVRYLGEKNSVNHFRVYLRDGEPCPKCRTPIQRINQGQRGTFYCPTCQRI